METMRQQKVARQIQKDLSDIFLKEGREAIIGTMVSVTAVRVSPDLSFARIYISVFPFDKSQTVIESLERNGWLIHKSLGSRIKNQLKQVPEILFTIDDSFEYIENIDNLLKH